MTTNSVLRSRLVRLMVSNDKGRISRKNLLRMIGPSNRTRADAQISQLVSDGVFKLVKYSKGDGPGVIFPGRNFLFECPICTGKTEKNDRYRLDLIERIRAEQYPVSRHAILMKFMGSARSKVDNQIGLLISDGVFISLGLGKRGMPNLIAMGKNFPSDKCPFCLHQY